MTSRPIRLLLVEGDVAEQISFERFVRSNITRYQLDAATGAEDAVRRLKSNVYDIALLDYRFKDGTAFDLLRALGTTPIIFLTGMGRDGAVQLTEMFKVGARTIGQDEGSCIVYGMPRVAWEIGASQRQLPLDKVAEFIVRAIASQHALRTTPPPA